VEVMDDTAIALPPLDSVLAGDLIERTRIGRLLAGYRDRKPADRAAITAALKGLSQLIVDFPCIVSIDINPLLADAAGTIALDARVEIDPGRVDEVGPNPALAIRPYPDGWEKRIDAGPARYDIRPIRPADIALYSDFLARIAPDDIRFRFLAQRKSFPHQMLVRLTQLDYAREMAFVALDAITGELAAVGRLSSDPDREKAEYALLVRTDLQGRGLGWALLSQLVDYARSEGIRRIEGVVLADNEKMLALCREFGFSVAPSETESGLCVAALELR
ncbi:MAG: GNAT family N-acetyltransferase, partial [Nitratireductor sp.]